MSVKNPLSAGEQVDVAYDLHRDLLARETRGPGDMEGAMHRLQSKYGLDYWQQWMCRYRHSASPGFIERLRQVYLTTLQQSVRRDLAKLKLEQARSSDATLDSDLVAEAEALLAKIAERRVKA